MLALLSVARAAAVATCKTETREARSWVQATPASASALMFECGSVSYIVKLLFIATGALHRDPPRYRNAVAARLSISPSREIYHEVVPCNDRTVRLLCTVQVLLQHRVVLACNCNCSIDNITNRSGSVPVCPPCVIVGALFVFCLPWPLFPIVLHQSLSFKVDPWETQDLGRGTEINPGKYSDTRIKPLALAFWPRPLHYRYTRTEICVRWGMAVTHTRTYIYIYIAVINQ
jgi:hypothetical protein